MHELRATASTWWDEWQLRVLVLGSLAAQYIMWFTAGKRKFSTSTIFRIIFVRLLFLGSDALALYALATLFNRQKLSTATQRRSSDLEVLWAPFLLMHLGGHAVPTISSIDSKDQWQRLTLITMSKAAVALYVFYKSWRSTDKRLLTAAILLFLAQVRKAAHKSLNLMLTSFEAMRKRARQASSCSDEDDKISPESFVQHASDLIPSLRQVHDKEDFVEATLVVFSLPLQLYLDVAIPSWDRLLCLKFIWFKNDGEAYDLVEDGLSRIFSIVYTKDILSDFIYKLPLSITRKEYRKVCLHAVVRLVPIVISISLFHSSHTEGYSREDVQVTLVLFYGTVLLELSFLFLVATFPWKWHRPSRIAQRSLLGYFIYKQKHRKLTVKVQQRFGFGYEYEGLKMQNSCNSCKEILALVHQHVKDGWLHGINDVEEYRVFNNSTGEWTLKRENCNQLIEWSSRYPMDESVLIWHLATDLCFYLGSGSPNNVCARRSREMSNYMVYLLLAKPDMLTIGSRSDLLNRGVRQLESLLSRDRRHGATFKYVTIRDLALDLIAEQWEATESSGLIGKAWELAQRLRSLNDEAKMWRVIQGVWVEMLCFSASRCRGYVHAKSLGSGGEYLSYVWLLQAYFGMETFPDKIQKWHLSSVFESSDHRSTSQRDHA